MAERLRSSPTDDLDSFCARLRARRAEIEALAMTRVGAISDPAEVADPAYLEGLRAAVAAAVGYGLEGVEPGEGRALPVPVVLLGQARVAARNRISLDTVLRRYFAGYTLLGDLLVEEAEGCGLAPGELKRLLRAQAARFDRLIGAISEEFRREATERGGGAERRRVELVKRLLGGELLDASELAYDLDATHLGLVAAGENCAAAITDLAASLDARLLLIRPEEQTAWAWLGCRRAITDDRLAAILEEAWPKRSALAIGEPGNGPQGWRLTHRQAAAALAVALRGPRRIVRYLDVAVLAAVLKDDTAADSLCRAYLAPLRSEPGGGEVALATLRAYFAADRNASSAAAALGVDRRTVAGRLRVIEDRLGRPLSDAMAELEMALRLSDLQPRSPHAQDGKAAFAPADTSPMRETLSG